MFVLASLTTSTVPAPLFMSLLILLHRFYSQVTVLAK